MSDIKVLKVTFWGHIRMIGFTLLIYTSAVFFVVYFHTPERPGLLLVVGIPCAISILPVFYIHYNYSEYNDEVIYELNRNVSITKIVGDNKKTYSIDEFEKFKYVASKSKLVRTRGFLFSDYDYVKLKLRSGEELTCTCLYSSNIYTLIKSYYPNVPMEQEGVFYPNVSEMDFE